jgi:hypothetical protein
MVNAERLLTDLKRLRKKLDEDLRRHHAGSAGRAAVESEWREARETRRTADTFETFFGAAVDQAAVHWILALVFLRFLEDNRLLDRPLIAGPGERLELAQLRQGDWFRKRPEDSDAEYLLQVFREVARLPGLAGLFDPAHNPLFQLPVSGDSAIAMFDFFRQRSPETGELLHDFTDPDWNTRFVGDLYQDLSEEARKRYALLQTPEFVEAWILSRTLDPAIREFGYEQVRMIDPTCGSGHFLLGGFARVLEEWWRHAPEMPPAAQAQKALDAVAGVDLNPFAVEIARDPESRSPATWEDHGAPKADQLAGLIEEENRPAAARTQPNTCYDCRTAFEPRKRCCGKPRCSTNCGKAFHASRNANVGQRGQRATLGAVIGDYPEETHPAAAGDQDLNEQANDSVMLREQRAIIPARRSKRSLERFPRAPFEYERVSRQMSKSTDMFVGDVVQPGANTIPVQSSRRTGPVQCSCPLQACQTRRRCSQRSSAPGRVRPRPLTLQAAHKLKTSKNSGTGWEPAGINGTYVGTGYGRRTTQSDADAVAMQQCSANVRGCRVVSRFSGGGCGYVTLGTSAPGGPGTLLGIRQSLCASVLSMYIARL